MIQEIEKVAEVHITRFVSVIRWLVAALVAIVGCLWATAQRQQAAIDDVAQIHRDISALQIRTDSLSRIDERLSRIEGKLGIAEQK